MLSTVTVTGSDAHCRPIASRATAVTLWMPLLAVVVFHGTAYGADVSSAPILTPSTLNCTPATRAPNCCVTSALTVMVPLTSAPDLGDVIVTMRLPCADAYGGDIHAVNSQMMKAAAQPPRIVERASAESAARESEWGKLVSMAPPRRARVKPDWSGIGEFARVLRLFVGRIFRCGSRRV